MTSEAFVTAFGREPEVGWRSPGRVNLIGEHTDYNDGFVLPLAIPREARVLAARRDDRLLRLVSAKATDAPVEVPLDGLAPGAVDGWAAYVAGTGWALAGQGVDVSGIFLCAEAELVGRAVDVPALHAAAGHPHGEAVVVVVAAVDLSRVGPGGGQFNGRRATELAAPDDEGVVQHAALLEVFQ